MNVKLIRRAVPLLLVGSGACARAMTAGSDFTPGIDFSRYTSFSWEASDDRPVGDPRLENNPFFVGRLHNAIERELFLRGIEQGAAGPALTVHHHATVRDHLEVFEADRAQGYETPEFGPGTQVVQYDEGTFLVDLADARTRQIIWRGWVQMDITKALTDGRFMEEQINAAVEMMFEEFPIRER